MAAKRVRGVKLALLEDLDAAMAKVVARSRKQVVAALRSQAGVLVAAGSTPDESVFVPQPGNLMDVDVWEEAVRSEVGPAVEALVLDSASRAAAGYAFDVSNPLVSRTVAARVEGVASWGEELRSKVADSVAAGVHDGLSITEMADHLSEGGVLSEARATLIARTEAISASNGGSLAGWRATGVATKTWLATEDDRTRPSHMDADGQEVPIDASFEVGGYSADYPGDPNLPVEERANCRCTVLAGDEEFDADTLEEDGAALLAGEEDDGAWVDDGGEGSWQGLYDRIATDMPGPESFTPVEQDSMRAYRGSSYRPINRSLRGLAEASEEVDTHIGALDAALDRSVLSHDVVTWRVVDARGLEAFFDDLAVGSEFTDPGFVSTTVRASDAAGLPDGLYGFRIHLPAGTHALQLDAALGSGTLLSEGELLLGRGTTLRVTAVDGNTIHLEAV